MPDAVAIMREAFERGPLRVDLVRAAFATVRAVTPPENAFLPLAMEPVERWLADPSHENSQDVGKAEGEILRMLSEETAGRSILRPEGWLLAAAAMVCFARLFDGTGEHPAVYAVEYASTAASGRDIDLGSIVTAELL
jgi:hypothetical protein